MHLAPGTSRPPTSLAAQASSPGQLHGADQELCNTLPLLRLGAQAIRPGQLLLSRLRLSLLHVSGHHSTVWIPERLSLLTACISQGHGLEQVLRLHLTPPVLPSKVPGQGAAPPAPKRVPAPRESFLWSS